MITKEARVINITISYQGRKIGYQPSYQLSPILSKIVTLSFIIKFCMMNMTFSVQQGNLLPVVMEKVVMITRFANYLKNDQ